MNESRAKLLVCVRHRVCFVFLLKRTITTPKVGRQTWVKCAFIFARNESTNVLYRCIHLTVLTGGWTTTIRLSCVTSLPLTIMRGPWSVCVRVCVRSVSCCFFFCVCVRVLIHPDTTNQPANVDLRPETNLCTDANSVQLTCCHAPTLVRR